MKKSIILLFVLGSFVCSYLPVTAQNSNEKAIHDVIDKYCQTEAAGDMVSQAKLMADDRVWIGTGAGRVTNQKKNMEMQQLRWDETNKFVPGIKWDFDARDRLIKFYGNGSTAVVSFYWYPSKVLPASTPMDKAKVMSGNNPSLITLVLEKKGTEWKIVHTHTSALSN